MSHRSVYSISWPNVGLFVLYVSQRFVGRALSRVHLLEYLISDLVSNLSLFIISFCFSTLWCIYSFSVSTSRFGFFFSLFLIKSNRRATTQSLIHFVSIYSRLSFASNWLFVYLGSDLALDEMLRAPPFSFSCILFVFICENYKVFSINSLLFSLIKAHWVLLSFDLLKVKFFFAAHFISFFSFLTHSMVHFLLSYFTTLSFSLIWETSMWNCEWNSL